MSRDPAGAGADDANESTTRRRFLGAAGATAAATPFLGTAAASSGSSAKRRGGINTGSVDGSNYETTKRSGYTEVIVGEEGYWECELDDFDALSNYLVDVSAPGANATILPAGRGWTVQHVGLRGTIDVGDEHPRKRLAAATPADGLGTVRNVYMGDGSADSDVQGAMYVPPRHAGELRFRKLNLQEWADNGVYGSPPGNPEEYGDAAGEGGVVSIRDSYGRNNGVASFRLGTDGSVCENCVSVGGDRGFWGYYEETDYLNCDSSGAYEQFRAGARTSEKGENATVSLENCRAEGPINNGPGTVEGEAGSNPRTSPPEGVPTSPKDAACGCSGDVDWTEAYRVDVVALDDAAPFEFRFDVVGDVAVKAGRGNRLEESGDVTTVANRLEDGEHAAFLYGGALGNFWTDADPDDYALLVNEQPADAGSLPVLEDVGC